MSASRHLHHISPRYSAAGNMGALHSSAEAAHGLFAGIRPDWKDGEIKKLQPQDIRFDTDAILIEPGISKVNGKRTIKMQPNLRQYPSLGDAQLRTLHGKSSACSLQFYTVRHQGVIN